MKLHVLLPFTKQICCTTINKFGIKYWTSIPVWVKVQEHGSSFYMNIEKKGMVIGEKILTDRATKTSPLGRNRAISMKPRGKVAHFACFGEPWWMLSIISWLVLYMCNTEIHDAVFVCLYYMGNLTSLILGINVDIMMFIASPSNTQH